MTAKRQPGSPLPWAAVRLAEVLPGKPGEMAGMFPDEQYAVHACNAYPRLVAALQKFADAEGNLSQIDMAISRASMLLIDLGETP